MILKLQLAQGLLYNVILLELIKRTKKLFIDELIMNKEVRIPKMLTIKFS